MQLRHEYELEVCLREVGSLSKARRKEVWNILMSSKNKGKIIAYSEPKQTNIFPFLNE
jgi:hypothetical protein